MSQRNTFFGLPDRPLPDSWRGVNISFEDAVRVLNAVRWPEGKPSGHADDVNEVSKARLSISDLVGAMQTAQMNRLTARHKRSLRNELRKVLGVTRHSEAAFRDLFEQLGI